MTKIYLVDDDPLILQYTSEVIRDGGFDVESSNDPHKALAAISSLAEYDLIITDVMMPKIDGWKFVRLLRSFPETSMIPVIFLTSLSSDKDRLRGYRLGADDFITKPFNEEELILRIKKVLLKSKQIQEELRQGKADGEKDFHGSIKSIGVASILNILEMEKRSGMLTFTSGVEEIRLYAKKGRIVRAETQPQSSMRGAECVYRLLHWMAGRFEFHESEINFHDELRMTTMALLMEGAQLIDEKRKNSEQKQNEIFEH